MFDQRIKSVLLILGFAAAIAVARVAQLQILERDAHRKTLENALFRPPRYLPFERGAITDRHSAVLAEDMPAWDIGVHYGVLDNRALYLTAQARAALQRRGLTVDRERLLEERGRVEKRIERMWAALARLSGKTPAELQNERERILRQVRRVRDWMREKTGRDQPIIEENSPHPIIHGVDRTAMLAFRVLQSDYPWLDIRPSNRRAYHDAEAFAHVLGRLRRVNAQDLKDDPNAQAKNDGDGDANAVRNLRRYQPNDRIGGSAAERLLEQELRGEYGIVDPNGTRETREEPVRGRDASLTIDAAIQREVYALLGERIAEINQPRSTAKYPTCPGGSAVVLYMPPGQPERREILALVSYPSYDPARFNEQYLELVSDAWRLPWMFRAVYQTYPAGSIVKPIVLAAALSEGKVDPDDLFRCPVVYKKKKCWVYNRPGRAHTELLDAERSLKHSCNIYYYILGEKLGGPNLSWWFEQFGLGRRPGTGLREESAGTVAGVAGAPPAERSDLLNLPIGQGPIDITPLHAANLMATLATGWYVPLSLRLDEPTARGARRLPVSAAHWRIIRNGLRRVVNDTNPPGAAPYARLDSSTFALYGKTGSAQFGGWRRTVRYAFDCRFPDGHIEARYAAHEYALQRQLRDEYPPGDRPVIVEKSRRTAERQPPLNTGRPDTHAWFIGYLQSKTDPGAVPQIAVAVNLEFAGGGGRLAGPLARDIARLVLDSPHNYAGRDSIDMDLASAIGRRTGE